MAQMEKTGKLSESPQTPRTSPTFEQHLRAEDAHWSVTMSPTIGKHHHHHHDQEEFASPTNSKKSVIAKVKERAKKLKHSLSGKKRQGNESADSGTATPPSWGVTLDDDDEEGEDEKFVDPEYLGAPMYESEAAPDTLKETARQHPRAVPVVSEKHVLPENMKHEVTNHNITNVATSRNDKHVVSNKTITETVSEKLAPAYAAVSGATNSIAAKIAGLTVTTPETVKTPAQSQSHDGSGAAQIGISPRGGKDTTKKIGENSGDVKISTPPGKWDKGISVKEYFMDAIEPGEEDNRALSEAITDAVSPKKSTSGGGPGVVDKVKEAVTSFFWHEESSNLTGNDAPLFTSNASANLQDHPLQNNAHASKIATMSATANSQPLIPVSSTAHEVVEEHNHGKILQAN